jgi:ATP-binding cassette subfamily F protein 3
MGIIGCAQNASFGSMTISLSSVSKNFASRCLLDDVTIQIGTKARLGLVGRNGCGKSTLLKIIMKQIPIDSGSIAYAPGCQVNYLSQEPRITPTLTLEQEMQSVFSALDELRQQEAELIAHLEHSQSATEEQQLEWINRLDAVHQAMDRMDAHNVDARIGRILGGLGFTQDDYQRRTGEFSGGWQMRINLAKVLLEGADLLLLDEPTNHLDLEACEWLEDFLSNYQGGLVIVSHDRRFLDQVVTEVAEIEHSKLTLWTGNYSAFLTQKAEAAENLTSAYERQQKDLAKQTAFVERFRASATKSTQAKSREKQLNKIERIEPPKADNRRMGLRFPPPASSGREVLTVRNLSKSFNGKVILQGLNAEMERGHKIFLLGANGCGKTTFLRLVLGLETPDSGEVKLGHNANLGYFSQQQLDTLDPKMSVFDTLQLACPSLTNTELRTHLGRFMFTGNEVFKPVETFSGGEKSKLALAKLVLSGANTLLLDEPTNHMDIPAKDAMTSALQDYEGSILCISHDRYFIQALATDIWEIHHGQLIAYAGDYEYYRQNREARRSQIKPLVQSESPKRQAFDTLSTEQKNIAFREKKEFEKQYKATEKDLLKAEAELAQLQAQLDDPTLQHDAARLLELTHAIETQHAHVTELNNTWLALADHLAKFDF